MKPRILIIDTAKHTDPALNERLMEAILRAGGAPVAISDSSGIDDCLSIADGVILGDGEAFCCDGETYRCDEEELRACDVCREKGLPLLGIGRGMQVISLVSGGSLTLKMQGEKNHCKKENGNAVLISHAVSVTLDTFIAYDPFKTKVNSAHSQCLKVPGEDIRVVAVAEDGVAEAIEHTKLPWVGVQWHPEYIDGACGEKIFEYLVALAKGSGE